MDEINERIKTVVSKSGLTKTAFAKQLNVTQQYVSNLCLGKKTPSDRTIVDICREFNVDETWLRTGEGEMFVRQSEADELASAVNRLITGESAEFKRRLINALSTLKDEHWVLLEEKLKEIIGMRDAGPNVPAFAPAHLDTAGQERTEPDVMAELAELKRQNQKLAAEIAEKKEEDALLKPMDTSEVSPSVSDGTLSPRTKK